MRAPIPASGRSESRARVARRLGARSILGASLALGAAAAAQGCGGSEFCSANSYECGNPSGGKAGSAGNAGNTSGSSGSSTGGGAGSTSGGSSSGGSSAGTAAGGAAGDGGESGDGSSGNGGEGGTGVTPPPACDPDALIDGCVPTDDAIYVATNGADGNDGTATAPLATIGAAVTRAASSGSPIFVCGGTFDEHVVVSDDGIDIHGGFACPRAGSPWVYDSTKRARVAPSTAGYALRVTNVNGLTVTDLELESIDATLPSESSIAVFVSRSTGVAFTRVGITAGNGANGENGTREGSNHFVGSLAGNNAGDPTNDTGGVAKSCVCPDATMSVGGLGGAGGPSPTGGGAGSPDLGGGKAGSVGGCSPDGTGEDGGSATASADGPGAMALGILASTGWTPAAGVPGLSGTPGQGGGGGAGALGLGNGGGGGGACGGCGGKGGGAGSGGGASLGLAAFRSAVSLTSVRIATGAAGDGGGGIEGEPGQSGGAGGVKTGLACNGGNGGRGADGAAGGGGAGGISVGILHTADSTITTTPSTTFDIGMAGAAGPAAMGSMNAGIPGDRSDTLQAS